MPLPYENSTSGDKALAEIQKLLRGFGCNKFGSMIDDDAKEIMVQFEHRGKPVSVKASISGYAAAWLKEHPYSTRMRRYLPTSRKRAFLRNEAIRSRLELRTVRCWVFKY